LKKQNDNQTLSSIAVGHNSEELKESEIAHQKEFDTLYIAKDIVKKQDYLLEGNYLIDAGLLESKDDREYDIVIKPI